MTDESNIVVADFEVPLLPGEDLAVCFGRESISFLGGRIGESITVEAGSAIYVEDWC